MRADYIYVGTPEWFLPHILWPWGLPHILILIKQVYGHLPRSTEIVFIIIQHPFVLYFPSPRIGIGKGQLYREFLLPDGEFFHQLLPSTGSIPQDLIIPIPGYPGTAIYDFEEYIYRLFVSNLVF